MVKLGFLGIGAMRGRRWLPDRAASPADPTVTAQERTLRELALVDPLTGLRNRRGFWELAQHELAACRRAGRSGTLLYLDLDGLKAVNDAFGRTEGDRMIRETAEVLRHIFRGSDVLARIGGDGFCVLLSRDAGSDETAVWRPPSPSGTAAATSLTASSCPPGSPRATRWRRTASTTSSPRPIARCTRIGFGKVRPRVAPASLDARGWWRCAPPRS